MQGRIIETDADVAEGAAWLAARELRFAMVLDHVGGLPLRRREDGFGALVDAIVGQQVSTASAAAILGRLGQAGLTQPIGILAAGEDGLRACGLSRPKIRYLLALAAGQTDFAALRGLADDEVITALDALPGIGRWTAEIYAMFALGRCDVIAAGDLALQESARMLFGLETRPNEAALRTMAEAWSPWRAVAARALWAYYRVAKGREGAV